MRSRCFKFAAIILIMIKAILPGYTQEKIKVELGQIKMSEGNQTAFTVFVPEATETALVQKAWKGFVSQESIIKYISKATTIGLVEISTKSKKEKKRWLKTLVNWRLGVANLL